MNVKIEFDAFQSMTSVTPFSTRLMTIDKTIRDVFEEHSVPELHIIIYRKNDDKSIVQREKID